MPSTVYIAIYDVLDSRDPNHWAIFIQGDEGSVILQVNDDKGGVGYYVEEPITDKQPQKSARHLESIAVGSVPSGSFDTAVQVALSTPVDNVSTTWNCQAWAVEALDGLADAGMFDWDKKGKKKAISKRQKWQ